VRDVYDVGVTLRVGLALVDNIQVAKSVLHAPRRAVSHIATRMTVDPPAAELADYPMCDLICARAAAMVEDKRTVMGEANTR
jgi:hypothetical protein